MLPALSPTSVAALPIPDVLSRFFRSPWARPAGVRSVPRGQCRFRAVDLSAIPKRDRRKALRVQLLGWSPFPNSQFAACFEDETHAIAYAWDAGMPATAPDAAPPDAPVVPESLLRDAPLQACARLVRCATGFEGEVWRDGRLLASRFWPHPPHEPDWQNFLRASAVAPGPALALPDPVSLPLRVRPRRACWSLDALRPGPGQFERVGVGSVLVLLLIASAHLAGQWWRHAQVDSIVRSELAALAPQAAAIEAQRARATSLLADAQALAASLPGVSPLDVIAHAQGLLLSAGTVRLHELEWQDNDRGALTLRLSMDPQVTRTALISALSNGWFSAIREEDGPNAGRHLVLHLTGSDRPVPRENYLADGTAGGRPPALPPPDRTDRQATGKTDVLPAMAGRP